MDINASSYFLFTRLVAECRLSISKLVSFNSSFPLSLQYRYDSRTGNVLMISINIVLCTVIAFKFTCIAASLSVLLCRIIKTAPDPN